MKVLVLSDTHGVNRMPERVFSLVGHEINAVIHLGDRVEDMAAFKTRFNGIPFYFVRGNCDFASTEEDLRIISFNGKKMMLTHGHLYSVKQDLQRLTYAAAEKEVQICLFGHTHLPALFADKGIVFMNPGSISMPVGGGIPSYGIIEIPDEQKQGTERFSIVAMNHTGEVQGIWKSLP